MPYGYDDDPYAAQVMLTTYRPVNVGDLGGPGYLGDYLGADGKFLDFLTQAATTTSQVASAGASGSAGMPAECRKPIGFALWRKARKDEWHAQCNAAMAASAVPEFQVAPASQSAGTPTWVYALGGLAAIAVVGGIVYTVTKD